MPHLVQRRKSRTKPVNRKNTPTANIRACTRKTRCANPRISFSQAQKRCIRKEFRTAEDRILRKVGLQLRKRRS